MRFTALTIVFGLHAVDGGGARRAPAPRDAGDLAAGRDIFLRRRRFTNLLVSPRRWRFTARGSAAAAALWQWVLHVSARDAAERLQLSSTISLQAITSALQFSLLARARLAPAAGNTKWLEEAKLLIRFAHRTPLARSEDSSGSAGRRLSIHAADCTGLLPCCGTGAERRRPALATASNYAFIVLRVANDAAERCKQLAFCSGSISAAVAFILRVSPTPPRSGASYNICSGKPAAECSLHAAGCQRCASPS